MRILIVANNDVGLYKFRRELVEQLLTKYEVYICLPNGEYIKTLCDMGCVFEKYEFDRHGTNPLKELKQISDYKKIIKRVSPDVVLTYTVKPNIYAGIACAELKIPCIANITGLGTAIENGGLMQKLLVFLYRLGLRKSHKVFFQNESNRDFMLKHKIVKGNYELIPGSGVNLDEHKYEEYPTEQSPIILTNIGRIMKDKGADELLYAAKVIHSENPNIIFRVVGGFDGAYEDKVKAAQDEGYIEYLGHQSDIHSLIKVSHAVVHPSYHEGMSNVLLESAACGRPVIATDVPGCRETYEEGVSGISCKAKDADSLVEAIHKFIELPKDRKEEMGKAGRKKAESEFDRRIVIQKYLEEIRSI